MDKIPNWLRLYKERKWRLERIFSYDYINTLQAEIASVAAQKKDRQRLYFAGEAHNKFALILSKLRLIKEPQDRAECEVAMQNLNKLEFEFDLWLGKYYYKLFPKLKPNKYGV